MSTRKFEPAWLLVIIIPVFFIIAIVAFLTSEECYANYCLTGWQALKLQWPDFWLFAWGGLILGAVLIIVAYFNESGKGWLGKKLRGSTELTIALVIIALLVMCGPWGKACTDRSNGGITAPGHKVEQPAP
jgi:hypothetical protein